MPEPAPHLDVARVFQALGDPTRRAIVERLSDGPCSVSALAEPLGVTVTAIAQHLQVLEACGLASTQKLGRVRTCRLETTGFDVISEWIFDRRALWNQRLDRLAALLAK
jgi:DNA-binding transcriptional ArsR family regulator